MSPVGHYPTDVSDAPWEVLPLVLPPPQGRPGGPGRQPLDLRRGITGLFYVHKTGWQWRMRPPDLGNGHTSYGSVRRWRRTGGWERVLATRRQWERQSQGRLPAPSACCADSQRLKPATPGEDVGFDGPKTSKGRKRHLLVETLGLMVAVVVTAAKMEERLGLGLLLKRYLASGVTRLRNIWVAGGDEAQWLCDWVRGLQQRHTIELEGVEHTGKGCQVVQHRGKGERTCAWLLNDRRHSRDYEV